MERINHNNIVKKTLRIIAWSIGGTVAFLVIALLCAVWYLNSKNLAPFAMDLANEHIEGKVSMKNLRVGFHRGLFVLGVEMDSLTLVSHAFESLSDEQKGIMPVYADSLLALDHLTGALDIKRLIFNNEISLKDVCLRGLSVNLVIAKNGKANYEVVKAPQDTLAKPKRKAPAFRINQFSLTDPKEIRFFNAADSTSASVLLLTDAAVDGHDQPTYRLRINGNVTSPKATLLTNLDQISFGLNGKVRWDPAEPGLVAMDEMELRGAFAKAIVSGEIDLTTNPIVKKAKVRLTPTSFTDILSMLPDSIKREHRLLPPDFATDAKIEGRFELTKPMNLTTDTFPSSVIDITIAPATLTHGKTRLSDIALDATVRTMTNLPDSTTIELKRFTMNGPGTQFTASAKVAKPMSDPTFSAILKGKVDFRDLPQAALDYIPGYIQGCVSADLQADGRASMLKPEQIHRLKADGTLLAKDIYFIAADTSKMVQVGKARITLESTHFTSSQVQAHFQRKCSPNASREASPSLNMNVEVDTATVLVSGIDLTFGAIRLDAHALGGGFGLKAPQRMPRMTGDLKVGRFNVTVLKDSAGARIRDIAGHFGMKGEFGKGRIPAISANLLVGGASAGTLSDRIILDDTKILASLLKIVHADKTVLTTQGGNRRHALNTHFHRKCAPLCSYIPPSEVRRYVLEKRRHGKKIKRVYSAVGVDNEEVLMWNLNEHFHKFINEWKIRGSVKTSQANLLSPMFPIRNRFSTIDIRFSNDTVNISDITLLAGQSDITFSGLVTNVRRALTADTANNLKANLSLLSDRIDINELSTTVFSGAAYSADKKHGKKHVKGSNDDKALAASLDAYSKESKGKAAPVLIPVNVDASLKLKAKKLLYGDLTMHNAGGDILVYDGGVNLHQLKANSDAGDLSLSALYSAPKAADMHFGFGLNVNDFNIGKLTELVPSLDSITPLMHDFSGMVGADIAATCRIDTGMNIVLPSLNAAVRITGDNLAFIDPEKYRTLGKWLGFKDKSDNTIHHLNVELTVEDGLLRVYPFAFNIDRYRLGVYGSNNFDMDFDYHLSILKSPLPFRFGITVKGNPKKYKVRLGGAKFKEDTAIESVDIVNKARINLIDQMEDVFRRGVRRSRFARLHIAHPSGFDEGDVELSAADSLQLIREGLIDSPAPKQAPAPTKEKKKRKRFWLF